ncbi:MAG: EamA family transporter [Dehalococcoidia bacterium]|nr:EamA family transporter [Dehalococcoidia bacterium]
MVGILLAALAAACWGASTVFTRLGLQHMRPTTGTLLSLIVGLLVVALPVLVFYRDEVLGLSAVVLLWFLVVGILNFPLGRLLNFTAVQWTGVTRSTPIIAISPVFAIALAVLFAGEQVTPLLLMGGLTTVAGIVLIVTQR